MGFLCPIMAQARASISESRPLKVKLALTIPKVNDVLSDSRSDMPLAKEFCDIV